MVSRIVESVGEGAAEGARVSGASRIIGVDLDRFEQGVSKKFGVTEFVNPKDYDRPVQEVIAEMTGGGVGRSVECTGNINAMISAFESDPQGHVLWELKPRGDIPGVVEKYMDKELELEKFVTHEVPFSEINKAFDLMFRGEGLRCLVRMEH
ncbi:unnamed protein product [Spirodela intermedia]|uniref:Alcohol dehydrogenase-like C-terminal domain-containing protein n=1 Tax=Spirodela intermedia TaxID=51605 RepID=A0A7I8IQU6_SPIIN|nr:unnamed protein product [Spirodela intermedia]CAA6660348.1 unnamed protein product [Spirodela intermedia]